MDIDESQTIEKNEYIIDEKNRVIIPKRSIMMNQNNDYNMRSF